MSAEEGAREKRAASPRFAAALTSARRRADLLPARRRAWGEGGASERRGRAGLGMVAQRGFTLLETLLAMAISVILVSALVVAIYQFSHLTRVYHNSLATGAQLQTAATSLNSDVISASSGRVIVNGDTQRLVLRVLHVTSASFGEPTLPAPVIITYTYTTTGATAGMLVRQGNLGTRVVARDIEWLSFGPSRTITSAVWVDASAVVGDQHQEATFLFQRRPTE